MPNFLLTKTPKPSTNALWVQIDGENITNWHQFFEYVSSVLDFPEYFEPNLDSFDECLNDLEWIEAKDIFFLFKNFELFLNKEKNDYRLDELLNLLDATAEDWKWVEDDETKKNLVIVIEDCPRAQDMLAQMDIAFEINP